MSIKQIFLLYAVLILQKTNYLNAKKPNIIIIIADDLGRNDVSFLGSNQIPTPNIDALALNGIILDRHYSQQSCTPSRAALLTGNYPIRSGMQGWPLKAGQNASLPSDMTTMPEMLKKLGYKTHLVGKWHLGASTRKSTPLGKGFDTHFGYWNGFVGYYDYVSFSALDNGTSFRGFDLHSDFEPAWKYQGKYATELFTQKSLQIIENHDIEKPLFLVLSHLAPHTGKNGTELEVSNSTDTDIKFSYIKDVKRRRYAGLVDSIDVSVGHVVQKLSEKKLLKNSIILFLSDNGAQTIGLYENSGSNWPLRGVKFSYFEGGVRTAAAIYSPLFKKTNYVSKQLIHISDWLPTFYAAGGGNVEDLGTIDGINQWKVLSENLETRRKEILLNIDEVNETSAIISHGGKYKLVKGTFSDGLYDHYYGESGLGPEIPEYSHQRVLTSSTNKAIETTLETALTTEKIDELRSKVNLTWCRNLDHAPKLNCIEGCLFNLDKDPCETTNINKNKPDMMKNLEKKIEDFFKMLKPQNNRDMDLKSNPDFYNGTWCTWLDDKLCYKTQTT